MCHVRSTADHVLITQHHLGNLGFSRGRDCGVATKKRGPVSRSNNDIVRKQVALIYWAKSIRGEFLQAKLLRRNTGPPFSAVCWDRKEAWSFYRTISGVHLCWELEEPKGPKGLTSNKILGTELPPELALHVVCDRSFEYGARGEGLGVRGYGQGVGCRVQGAGCRVQGVGCRV